MKDISIYFKPIDESQLPQNGLAKTIISHRLHSFPTTEKGGIAIFFVPEYRNSNYFQEENTPYFRNEFGKLQADATWTQPIYDLGDILPGKSIKDTYHAVTNVCEELFKNGVFPLIIGGGQDLVIPMYGAYAKTEQTVNIASIDREFDLGDSETIHSNGYLSHLLLQKPCFLFNYSVIGYQTPYVNAKELGLFEKLYFDACRLGAFTKDTKIAEPLLRNADCVTLDLTAIRSSDFQGKQYVQPNGFSGDEICQLARYAGVSDKVSSFLLGNYFPEGTSQSANMLIAELLWYFIDGYNARVGDFPVGNKSVYTKFYVEISSSKDPLVFYKSNKSERWWLEVPYPPKKGIQFERHHLVPCSFADYQEAMKDDVPELWWRTYQKLIV